MASDANMLGNKATAWAMYKPVSTTDLRVSSARNFSERACLFVLKQAKEREVEKL